MNGNGRSSPIPGVAVDPPPTRLTRKEVETLAKDIRFLISQNPKIKAAEAFREIEPPIGLTGFTYHFRRVKEEDNGSAPRAKKSPEDGKESVHLSSGVGEYAAHPIGNGQWEVTMRLTVDRRTALAMNAEAWSRLFPDER